MPQWAFQYTWWRWYQGDYQLKNDRRLGQWAAKQVEGLKPDLCYVFTQVGLETLRWARSVGIRTVLDNPNGHIRHYREVCVREARRWCDSGYLGHPTKAMVERVEEEYTLADRIRVSSPWAKTSMTARGVPASKIEVVPQPIDLIRFRPKSDRNGTVGPLRICFVGEVGLAKGFVYLTRAIRDFGAQRATLEIVGATGNPHARRLLEKERRDISLTSAPGDPLPAYHRAELLVLPSLHDGFGFVVAEAMACGLPVIVTEDSGASSLVLKDENGWVVPSGKVEPLAEAMEVAMERRSKLAEMGLRGRAHVERFANPSCMTALREWAL
jgi:glycosyltransferase involved in cell wall biosynthesis